MLKKFLPLIIFLISACTIDKDIRPIPTTNLSNQKSICIVKNLTYSRDFYKDLAEAIGKKGYNIIELSESDSTSTCPLYITYEAKWSWDILIYLSYADIRVYNNNNKEVAFAVYDTTRGLLRVDKWGFAKTVVNQLVDDLFTN